MGRKSLRKLGIALFVILFFTAYIFNNIFLENWAILGLIIVSIRLLATDKKNILLILFISTLIVFDLGVYFSHLFDTSSWWKLIQGSMTRYSYEDNDISKSLLIMVVSLICILLGYYCSNKIRLKFTSRSSSSGLYINEENDQALNIIRKHIRIVFYISSVGNLLYYLYKAYLVITISYVYLYTSYNDIWILKMSSLVSYVSFYCFLATYPTKRECKGPAVFFIICSIGSILTGNRGTTVSNILFVLFYYYIREYKDEHVENWVPRNAFIYIVIAVPISFTLLGMIGNFRSGNTLSASPIEYATRLFASQGESGLLLTESVANLDSFKYNNVNFTFGEFIRRIQGNQQLSSLFGLKYLGGVATQSEANALWGNTFGCAISYTKMKYTYLNGYNLGTYYLAEIWADYEWIGILLFNFILGIVIAKISNTTRSNFYSRSLLYGVITQLLLLGRHSFSNLALFFMSTAVLLMYMVFFLDYRLTKRK